MKGRSLGFFKRSALCLLARRVSPLLASATRVRKTTSHSLALLLKLQLIAMKLSCVLTLASAGLAAAQQVSIVQALASTNNTSIIQRMFPLQFQVTTQSSMRVQDSSNHSQTSLTPSAMRPTSPS